MDAFQSITENPGVAFTPQPGVPSPWGEKLDINTQYSASAYEPIHMKRMTALEKIKLNVLVRENDTHLTSNAYCEYKWVPQEQFANVSLYIYGDKVAFIEFSERDVTATVVENRAVTESQRKMFHLAWENASTRPDI